MTFRQQVIMPVPRRPYPDYPMKGARITWSIVHAALHRKGAGPPTGGKLLWSTEGQVKVSVGQGNPVQVYWPVQAASNLQMAGRRTGGLHVSNIHTSPRQIENGCRTHFASRGATVGTSQEGLCRCLILKLTCNKAAARWSAVTAPTWVWPVVAPHAARTHAPCATHRGAAYRGPT